MKSGLQIRSNIVNLLRGLSDLRLPKHIENKRAIMNVQNFKLKIRKKKKYAILPKYDSRKNKYKYFNYLEKKSKLIFNCIYFPTPIN